MIISSNNSVLDRAVLDNKSGSLSWGSKYNSFPSAEAKPWPAKNIIRSDWSALILPLNHLVKALLVLTNVASSSTNRLIFCFLIPNPFLA